MKYVQTVCGRIKPEEMGFTLPHEHIFWDLSFYLPDEVKGAPAEDRRRQPICLENLGDLKFHLWEYADNVIQQDEEVAYRELLWYKEAGGGTICDNSSYGLRG